MSEVIPVIFSRRTALIIAIGWTCFIIVLLSLPGSSFPDSKLWNYDKLGHVGIFFVLALVWMNALSAYGARVIVSIVIVGLFLAPLSEWYQSLLPFGRTADVFDSLADAVGFALGTIAWLIIVFFKRRGQLPGNFQQ
jgi:VanZ family protein